MGYTNSPLVSYVALSPNHSGQRVHGIDRITPHCVVGQVTVKRLGQIFAPASRKASCQYGIGVDGRVGMYVEEMNRSWCTSSNANDQRAVTIECASDNTHPYAMNASVYTTLVNLCVDICSRNGKDTLLWINNKDKALAYEPKPNEMVLTAHRWFAAKSCPGDWLYSRLGDLATAVTERLAGKSTDDQESGTIGNVLYRVQVGAFTVQANAETLRNTLREKGYEAIVSKNGEYYRVQVGALRNKQNATALANKLRFDGYSPFLATTGGVNVGQDALPTVTGTPTTGSDEDNQMIWNSLMDFLDNECGVAGLMGNLYAESSLRSDNLQNSYEAKLGFNDTTYTQAVDSGNYTNFVHDSAGYGLAQWTFWSRKEKYLEYMQKMKKSIGDGQTALEYLKIELSKSYPSVVSTLKTATSVHEASDVVFVQFERPANQSQKNKDLRASYGQTFYNRYAKPDVIMEQSVPVSSDKTYIVKTGDTLSRIASMYHIDYAKLAAYNNLKNPNKIRAGQTIKIPS